MERGAKGTVGWIGGTTQHAPFRRAGGRFCNYGSRNAVRLLRLSADMEGE
jgi:hypothetical protein